MSASLKLEGIANIKNEIDKLERRIGRRILAQMGRGAMTVIKKEIIRTLPVGPEKDGKHEKDAVKVIAGKRSSVAVSYKCQISAKDILPTRGKKSGQLSWYPSAVEFGAVTKHIAPGGQQRAAFENKKYEALAVGLQIALEGLEAKD